MCSAQAGGRAPGRADPRPASPQHVSAATRGSGWRTRSEPRARRPLRRRRSPDLGTFGSHDVVCNLATNIPPTTKAARRSAWAANDRIRRGLTPPGRRRWPQAPAASCRSRSRSSTPTPAAGLHRDHPSKRLLAAFDARAPRPREAQPSRHLEGGTGVLLRCALFYGPDSHHLGTRRRPHWPGAAWRPRSVAVTAYMSSITTDDAAMLWLLAPGPSRACTTSSTTAASPKEHFDSLARRRPVSAVPPSLPRSPEVGGSKTEMLAGRSGCRTSGSRRRMGWAPEYPERPRGLAGCRAAMENGERTDA